VSDALRKGTRGTRASDFAVQIIAHYEARLFALEFMTIQILTSFQVQRAGGNPSFSLLSPKLRSICGLMKVSKYD
jgi:hypothetical protein